MARTWIREFPKWHGLLGAHIQLTRENLTTTNSALAGHDLSMRKIKGHYHTFYKVL